MTNGIDTYEYDLSNPSQPMSVGSVEWIMTQTYRETGDDFITSLAYSPTKFVIQGMISGIVQVKYLK